MLAAVNILATQYRNSTQYKQWHLAKPKSLAILDTLDTLYTKPNPTLYIQIPTQPCQLVLWWIILWPIREVIIIIISLGGWTS